MLRILTGLLRSFPVVLHRRPNYFPAYRKRFCSEKPIELFNKDTKIRSIWKHLLFILLCVYTRAFKISRRPPELRRVLRGLSPVTFFNISTNLFCTFLSTLKHRNEVILLYSTLSMTISIPFLFESNQCLCFKNVDNRPFFNNR